MRDGKILQTKRLTDMINYLQIFLLPKNSNIIFESNGSNLKIQEGCAEQPLLLSSIQCDSDIFEQLNAVVDVPSINKGTIYRELTIDDIRKVINHIIHNIEEVDEKKNNLKDAYNSVKTHTFEEYKDYEEYYITLTEIHNEYVKTRNFYNALLLLLSDVDCSYCDIEKILVKYG